MLLFIATHAHLVDSDIFTFLTNAVRYEIIVCHEITWKFNQMGWSVLAGSSSLRQAHWISQRCQTAPSKDWLRSLR